MIRVLVVDDDASNRDYLVGLLGRHPELQVVGQAANIGHARGLIEQTPPDLLFLDVEMPGGTGFDLLHGLGTWPFGVIFTTAFQRYAIQAIRFSAFDYLLKPVQPDELAASVERFLHLPVNQDRTARQSQLLANLGQPDPLALKLTLTHGDRTYFVPPADISHCLADDNYTLLHLREGRHFTSARTLKEYDDMLAPFGFLRIHRSSLVNRWHVSHVDDQHVVLKAGQRLELSRRKREEVLRVLAL
jgi:two-component system LytT family response regulator